MLTLADLLLGVRGLLEMSKSRKGRNFGRCVSIESRLARSKARTGYVYSEEIKEKIRAGNKGKLIADSTRAKIKEARGKQMC